VDRKKPPTLTSPWKVGFLVALMLVVTGLGVSYFITGTFGVSWHWLTIGGPSPTQWTFNLSAFVSEMLPLIGLISMLAFATSALVSGAVRRYKTYVDSGAEYKNLLRSIKSIEDLEDEEKIEKLKQHPELREFLMGLKHRLAAKDRHHPERERERERKPEPREAPARFETLATEAAALTGAISGGVEGLARELSLTIPELKQIERAVRQRVGDQKPVRDEKADAQRRELESRLGSMRSAVAAVRREADACSSGARELEAAVSAVKQSVAAAAATAAPAGDVAALAKRVDALAGDLTQLGEETKRIAIASALQASGGSDDDSIRVADEVRAIATRFNTVAQQWKECGPALRRALDTAAGSATATERQRGEASKSVAAAASKASLWSERLVVLAEKLRALEQAAGQTGAAAPDESPREWGAVDIGADARARADEPAPRTEAFVAPDEDFQTQSAAKVFAEDSAEDAPFADIPGFEKEKGHFFVESAGRAEAEDESERERVDEDGRFVVDGNNTEGWEFTPRTDTTDTVSPAPPTSPAAREDGDGFLTGPRATLAAKGKGKKASRTAPVDEQPEAVAAPGRDTVATMESEAGVVDLYALGAVDFDERVHA
jgi:hypothetical protein